MALFVNTNVASLNAQRNLMNATSQVGKSLERLSSGLRINRAGDDAAGLAISEGLRSEIRGLNRAVQNANDGISMIGTAEGAVNEVTNILQRMRELAVQAVSDTNSAQNRSTLQSEVDQLIAELGRIADSTQFNGKDLLDGTFTDQTLQVGAFAGQTLSFSIGNLNSNSLGAIATDTGTATTTQLASGDLLVNGTNVGASESDGVSTSEATSSALAIANAINSAEGSTNVHADVNATTVTGSGAVGVLDLDAADDLEINGVDIYASVLANDEDNSLINAINAQSGQTGVTAELDGSNKLVLSAADGRNIAITASGSAATALGVTSGTTTHGTVTLTSTSAVTVGGANVAYAGLSAGTTNVDTSTAVDSVKVSTAALATTAITRIDYALQSVNSTRSDMGAITNRLESTIANLRTTAENLTASESRIRDTDFASETANLMRNQILQQAGVAILAQANLTPQAALALLG